MPCLPVLGVGILVHLQQLRRGSTSMATGFFSAALSSRIAAFMQLYIVAKPRAYAQMSMGTVLRVLCCVAEAGWESVARHVFA